MAAQRSEKYPHRWPDGTYHSITYQQHVINQNRKATTYSPPGYSPAQIQQVEAATGQQALGPNAGQPLPPGPPVVPQQPDPDLALATLTANRNIQLGDADAAWQTANLARSSGFNADGTRNLSNPYSEAQLLEDSYRRWQAGTVNSMAAAGQFNSGAHGRAQARNTRLYGQGYDQVKTGAQTGYYGIGRNQLSTYANNSLGKGNSSFDALYKSMFGGGS